MRPSPLAYAPRATPLGRAAAGAATVYLWSFAAIAFVVGNPLVLAGCAAAVTVAGLAGGARHALGAAVRWGIPLGLLIVAVNVLASQRGDTILVRGPDLPVLGPLDVSAEALAEGGVLAMRIVIVLAAFAVHTACVDPDRLLRLARPIARRSALTATLIARLAPLAAADHMRIREAAVLRGPGAAPVTRAAIVHRLVSGSLDRAVDVAATLDLRGYASGAPARSAGRRRAPGDLAFACAGLAALALVVAARIAGVAGFDAYPTIAIDAGAGTLAVAASLPAAAAAPVLLDRLRARQVAGPVPAHA